MPVRKKLTDRALRALKPASAWKRTEIFDAVVPPLMVRVTPAGHVSFVLYVRVPKPDGKRVPARLALGAHPAMALGAAREKAKAWLELIERGKDPRIEEEKEERAERQRRANTFAFVAEQYIEDHVLSKRKGYEVAAAIRREFIPRWGDRPISDITRSDVVDLVREVKGRGTPYQARNLLGYLRTMFDWSLEQDEYGLKASPCANIRPSRLIGAKIERQRVLNDDELRRLAACGGALDCRKFRKVRIITPDRMSSGEIRIK